MQRYLFFIAIFLSVTERIQAQHDETFSFNFGNARFIDIVNEIELRTAYSFYFKKSDVDTLNVNLQVTDLPFVSILDHLFKGTDLHYVIDPSRNVFITKIIIDTNLAENFFQEGFHKQESPPYRLENVRMITRDKSRGNRVYEIGTKANYRPGVPVVLSGVIKNSEGQPLSEASIQVEKLGISSTTLLNGQYTLSIPAGSHELLIRHLGMSPQKENIMLYSSGVLDIEMYEEVRNLEEVLIRADKSSKVESVTMGVEKLSISEIKNIPTALGEVDVLRAVLTLPGVKSVGEASVGFNVRGGASDQNLILLNDAVVYNPSHFFGFFSAFNSEIIRDVELHKSTIPAKYGGRLSSVLQVTGKEGNQEKIRGSAGISLVTCRFNVEGPISNSKTHFVAGVRTTYSDWIFGFLPESSGLKNTEASFYDVNFNVSHDISSNDNISLTSYLSHDESNLNTDTLFRYNNRNISIKWQHTFTSNFTSSVTYGIDHYDYSNQFNTDTLTAYRFDFDLNQQTLRANFILTQSERHTIEFGLQSTYYNIKPGSVSKGSATSVVSPVKVPNEHALETALYIEDQYTVRKNLSLNVGLRYSMYNYFGPRDIITYDPSLPKTQDNAVDTTSYANGKIIKTYHGLDVRVSGRYNITKDFSIKAGYASTRQFIHMLSNTVAISPTDIWKLSDPNIKPQLSQQISIGLYKDIFKHAIEVSVEGYLKEIKNYLDYKSGAKLLATEHIETEVFSTKGKAYGIETLIRKPYGNFNGWISYTYSRTLLRNDDPQAGENINKGNFYPANYDKPHDFTFVGNQKFSRRFSISTNVTYSTGRPITVPVGVFYYGNDQKTLYGNRNSYRIPDYFRADISLNIEGNHKVKQRIHGFWTVGVYNLTGRKNPYSIYFTTHDGVIKGYKLSIFGSAIPFVNFTIKF